MIGAGLTEGKGALGGKTGTFGGGGKVWDCTCTSDAAKNPPNNPITTRFPASLN